MQNATTELSIASKMIFKLDDFKNITPKIAIYNYYNTFSVKNQEICNKQSEKCAKKIPRISARDHGGPSGTRTQDRPVMSREL